jgi:hypothetical protein
MTMTNSKQTTIAAKAADFRLDPATNIEARQEDGLAVFAFLRAARPLIGCSYDGDNRFIAGQQLVTDLAAHLMCNAEWADEAIPLHVTLTQCGDVIYFLHNIQPVAGKSFCDGNNEHMGHSITLQWIERTLMAAATPIN